MTNADVDAPEAWNLRTGNERLVIAIIDTGVDTGHLDLRIFRNDAEWGNGREANGVDNDGNGYIDDHQGWDFYGNDNDPNPGSSADAAHGTGCAGVAGAIGSNSKGIAGATWNCRILPVKIWDDTGTAVAPVNSLAQSIRYAAQFADAISCSWGGGTPSSAIDSAIDYATVSGRDGRGCPVFFASGNDASYWEVPPRRLTCPVPTAGNYKFGFRALAVGDISGTIQAWLVLDQVRVLATNGYSHHWHDDFETGSTGWTVAHGGGMTSDWYRHFAASYDFDWWPGSAYTMKSPDFNGKSEGAWAELRTPTIWLPQGTCHISLMTTLSHDYARNSQGPLNGQIWLLNANDQPLQLLNGDGQEWGRNWGSTIPIKYPASYVNSIAVGACTDLGMRSYFSLFGSGLFCVAPSHGGWNSIITTDTRGAAGANNGTYSNGDYWLEFGGTSAATPLTAGVAALILSRNGNLTLAQLKDSLRLGCEQIGGVAYTGSPPWNQEYGHGRINAYNSLNITAPDTTPPIVASVIAKTGRAVEVTFSEQMGSGVTSDSRYSLSGTGRGTLISKPDSVSWVAGNTFLLEWMSGEMIAGTGNITVTVNTLVKDIVGNGMGTPRSGSGNGSRVIHAHNYGPLGSSALYPIYPFESERNYFSGVGGLRRSDAVDGIINNDGTAAAVYASERSILGYTSYPGDIVYTLPNLNSLNHKVRLYFFNNGLFEFPGEVKFAVYINGVSKISSLDLWAESGGMRYGFWKEFTNIIPQNGNITVRVVPLSAFNHESGLYLYSATLSGIKITAQ